MCRARATGSRITGNARLKGAQLARMAHKEWEGTAHSGRSLHPYLRTNLNCGLTSLSVKPPENSGSRYGSPGREPLVLGNRTASKGAHVKWLPSPEEEAPRAPMSQRRSGAVSRLDTVYASPAVLRQARAPPLYSYPTRSTRTHRLGLGDPNPDPDPSPNPDPNHGSCTGSCARARRPARPARTTCYATRC